MRRLLALGFLLLATTALAADPPPDLKITPGKAIVPTNKMRRVWGELIKLDLKTRTGSFRNESNDEIETFTVLPYAELLHHATFGDLQDFTVGERAIFRLHQDEDGKWVWLTYIQDEMNMLNGHKEYFYVDKIDAEKGRIEYTQANFDKSFVREKGLFLDTDAKTRYWKDGKPAKFSDIQIGDKLRAKTHGVGKGKVHMAWEVFLDDASLEKFRQEQIAVNRKRLAEEGLPGYVDDRDGKRLALTLFQEARDLAKELKVGQKVRVAPAGTDRKPTAAAVPAVVDESKAAGALHVVKLTLTDEPPAGIKPTALVRLSVEPPVEGKIAEPVKDSNGLLSHSVESEYQKGPTEIKVLPPDKVEKDRRFPVVYVLPVEAGTESRFGNGLLEIRKLDLHNKLGLIFVAPTFSHLPWYADHPTDPAVRQESYFLKVVVPFIESKYPALAERRGRLLLGFSKSGFGVFSLLLRHPDRFGRAAAWDAPLNLKQHDRFGSGDIYATPENFENYRVTKLLEQRAADLGPDPRLALVGYANFHDDHQAVHELMTRLKIPHEYRDEIKDRHTWDAGWLAEATRFLVEPEKPPKPTFNGPFFGKMPRAWVEILKVDPEKHVLTVRTKQGEQREVPIRGDTELRVRDDWGDLSDYYPGESVMLFMYHDSDGNWVYPRAVQDEVQMMSLHKWWWTVDALDAKASTVELSRKEKDKTFKESFRVGPATKVWKGDRPAGLDTLAVGDVVLFQTRFEKGEEKRFAVEFFDEKGLAAIKAEQKKKHRERLMASGLPAVVNDLDVLTGAVQVSVQWAASDVAKGIKPGESVELTRPGEKPLRFSAPVSESKADGVRHKLLLAADPAAMTRLKIGDEVRIVLTAR